MFYRTSTLFVTAWKKIVKIKSSSCFDVINELAKEEKITLFAKYKLSYAVALAQEVTVRVYMNAKSQHDYIQSSKKSKTVFDEILKFVDKDSILSYFQVSYCLQNMITVKSF